jgi:hypothetical protein
MIASRVAAKECSLGRGPWLSGRLISRVAAKDSFSATRLIALNVKPLQGLPIQHQVDDHSSNGDVHPYRESPPRNSHMACEAFLRREK